MKSIYLYIVIGIVLLGCKNQPTDTSVYIGGEIINPKSNQVLLMQKDKIIDSIPIADNNTFGKRISNIEPGLYYFKHGYEFQYLYLEPADSIHFRLNTWDFDETLVFEGKGAQKNELLLNLFLENEKEEAIFYSYFSLNEKEFEEKINDAIRRHTELLTTLVDTDLSLSKQFIHLAKAAIKYPLYRLKEVYPYYHKKVLKLEKVKKVSTGFYDYRKDLNLNDSFLSEYYAYQNFVIAHLHNLAHEKNDWIDDDKKTIDELIQLIAKKIKISDFRNRILHREIIYLFFNKPDFLDDNLLDVFYNNCTDSILVEDFNQLLKDREALPINSRFPNFKIQSNPEGTVDIEKIIRNKDAVIYFVSSKDVFSDFFAKRIRFLENKYPQIAFIGINYNDTGFTESCLNKKLDNQYYIPSISKGQYLISKQYTRAVLVNSKGHVVVSFTLLYNWNFENQLNKLLKK